MKTKQLLRVEIKGLTETGSFEGILSPYGNVDQGGDTVERGAYTKTLQERGGQVPMLWQHSVKDPIGILVLEDRHDGLWCKGQFLMEDPTALRAYRFVKAGIVKGLSIGFEAVKDSIENGVRKLKEIKLYEGSVVTFPMNESALIRSVKGNGETKGDFNEELTQVQLEGAGDQMIYALRSALSSVTWADLSREDKIAARSAIVQQFADADAAYVPQYLDMLAERYGAVETWAAKHLETKAGRMISAANATTIQSACEHMMEAHKVMSALIAEEAGAEKATTPEVKAADEKPEPVTHSAAKILDALEGMRSLLSAA